MAVLRFLMAFLSVFFLIKRFLMFDTRIMAYNYNKVVTIERLKDVQLCCDIFGALYNLIITFICGYGAYVSFLSFSLNKPENYTYINIIIISILFCIITLFLTIKHFVFNKKNIVIIYNNMVDYLSKQEVVTDENYHESLFLRTYRYLENIEIYSYIWLLISVIMFIVL